VLRYIYIYRWLEKDLVGTHPETAKDTLLMNSYFYNKLDSIVLKSQTELERYYGATRTLSTDLFKKKYVLIPVNKQ